MSSIIEYDITIQLKVASYKPDQENISRKALDSAEDIALDFNRRDMAVGAPTVRVSAVNSTKLRTWSVNYEGKEFIVEAERGLLEDGMILSFYIGEEIVSQFFGICWWGLKDPK